MDDGFHLFLIKILSAINLNHGLVCELRIETHKLIEPACEEYMDRKVLEQKKKQVPPLIEIRMMGIRYI